MELLTYIHQQKERIAASQKLSNALLTRNGPKAIEWETDINEIDITKLRNGVESIGNAHFSRIETRSILNEYEHGQSLSELLKSGDPSYIDLLGLMVNGTKIIPPLYLETAIYLDGEPDEVKKEFMDGSHRMALSKALGLPEIPILVYRRRQPGTLLFTPDKWAFENKEVAFESHQQITKQTLLHCTSKELKKEFYLNPTDWIVSVGNTEYIELSLTECARKSAAKEKESINGVKFI